MKTYTMNWTTNRNFAGSYITTRKLNRLLCQSANLFLAVVPALAVVVAATWLITAPDLVVYLQAGLWLAGFVFLGIAVDSVKPVAVLSLVTGLALPILALISSHVAVEVAVLAVAVLAVWTAVAIWRFASRPAVNA